MHPVEKIINFLCERKLRLAIAESCTAGMAASMLADFPGCGSVLEIGYVVYTEAAKNRCLGVSYQTIKRFGLTSEEVALEMALGALDTSDADISLAITGTAESNDHLNGVICFAFAVRGEGEIQQYSETIKFYGDRNSVRKQAAKHVILSIPGYYSKLVTGAGGSIP